MQVIDRVALLVIRRVGGLEGNRESSLYIVQVIRRVGGLEVRSCQR